MGDLYLKATEVEGDILKAPIESIICLSALNYIGFPKSVKLYFVVIPDNVPCIKISSDGFVFTLATPSDVPKPASFCSLPSFQCSDSVSCVAGLCGVLRQVIRPQKGGNGCDLLGFREACLAACAEVSVWTKFCEIELPLCVGDIIMTPPLDKLPLQLARLENHLGSPIRVHNISKFKDKEHKFVEGPFFTLADVIISVQIYIILTTLDAWNTSQLPLVNKWMSTMLEDDKLSKIFSSFHISPLISNKEWILPTIKKESLYKSDPTRYKPKHKIFTQQVDIDSSIKTLSNLTLKEYTIPVGIDIDLDEKNLPLPDVPSDRKERKLQQLLNLTKATLQVSRKGDIIVDFCSGSGHLGLIIATCLPDCTVVLLDNKEKSLERAKIQITKLKISNILIVQANLDYFTGHFQVGVSLHACGVASDLVIQKCLKSSANIVVCPCCYGGIQENHMLVYPQSDEYREAGLTERSYVVLGHCADQAGTEQGELGMQAVDTDRCFFAQRFGYTVTLAKLIPPSCTTRNNLIVATKTC